MDNNKWRELLEIIDPYLDHEKMDLLQEKDEETFLKLTDELIAAYGIDTPLKKGAPKEVVEAYKEYGRMYRESVKGGTFGGPM